MCVAHTATFRVEVEDRAMRAGCAGPRAGRGDRSDRSDAMEFISNDLL